MGAPVTRLSPITAEQAQRGIYVDFEGNIDEPPSLLGIRCDGRTRQVIVEPALASFSELSNARYTVEVLSLSEALAGLREQATAEKRLIMGFTTHEVSVVDQFCRDEDIAEWFILTYVNVKKHIDRWIRSQVAAGQVPEPEDRSLFSSMAVIGMAYKPGTGPGVVGKNLRRMREQLDRHGTAAATSKGTRQHWWKILSHNSTDLEATQLLLERAVGDR